MKNRNIFILYIVVTTFITSCSDVLNVEPTSVITVNSFWQDEASVNGALAGSYVYLRNITRKDLYIYGEARSEMVGLGIVGEGGWSKYYDNTLSADDAGPSWKNFYTLINSANLLIKYVPDIDFTSEANKNNILAQAYSMRAFAYFTMTKIWGDLVIHTDPIETADAEVTQKERSSQAEVFSLIKADLDMALQLFPTNDFPEGRNIWSKPAANALKGDVYLWTGKRQGGGKSDFEVALNAFNEVENSGQVRLLADYAQIHDFNNKGNDEIIMSSRYDEFESPENFYQEMHIIGTAIPQNIDQATRDAIGKLGSGSNNIIVITKLVRDQFVLDDTRRNATFFEINDTLGNYITTISQKCMGMENASTRKFLSDIVLYRYADILLMRAEVNNALGNDPTADINKVRRRAYRDNYSDHIFINGTQAENDDAILKERLLELALEGKRWWDLVRFDKAFELVPSLEGKSDEGLLLFPIGLDILSLEPKVKQNPGWGFSQ